MIKFITVLFFLGCFQLSAQEKIDHLLFIKKLKTYELDSIPYYLESYDEEPKKSLIMYEYNYQKYGDLSTDFLDNEKFEDLDLIDSILFHNYLGDYYARKPIKEYDKSFSNHLKALKFSKSFKDTLLINESLRRVMSYFIINNADSLVFKKYLMEMKNYVKDSTDRFWQIYYNAHYTSSFDKRLKKKLDSVENQLEGFKDVYKKHPYFYGLINQRIGIFHGLHSENNIKARKAFEEASKAYEDSSNFYSYSRKFRTDMSLAITDYKEQKYDNAVREFHKALKNKHIKNEFRIKMFVYDWLSKIYDETQVIDSSNYYLKLKDITKDSLAQYELASKIYEIDKAFDTEEQVQKNEQLTQQNMDLKTRFYSLIPLLSILLLLALVFFYFYRRYKKRSEELSEEKSETIKKIDELKNIIIKNHIVLKDKTKVYIADLMYIKSDDHYLNIFTSDAKSHFVRGKLKQIKEELPPNFIQCHRSYVVNANFIKQVNKDSLTLISKDSIPLSRSYKDKF